MAVKQIKSQAQRAAEAASKLEAAKGKPRITENQIEFTYEYDVFERMPGNRPVSESHVLNLMRKMRQKDLLVPIQINQNFEVVDGQHRLEARRRLNLIVPYFASPEYGLEEVQALNATQKRWTNEDFVQSYIELGKKDYLSYRWFRHRYKLPHNQSLAMLTGLTNSGDSKASRAAFKSGDLKVTHLEEAKKQGDLFLEIANHFEEWNNSRFVHALLQAMRKKHFDFKEFMKKLEAHPGLLKPQPSSDAYLQNIEDLYNYKRRDKVAIRFGEDK